MQRDLVQRHAARREPRQQIVGEMQARGRRRDRAVVVREQRLVVGAVLLVRLALARRYRAAAACRRARRSPGRAPARGTRTTASPRRPRPWPRPWRRAGRGSRPCPPRRSGSTSPAASFFAGRTKARQREPSSRCVSVASIFGSVSRPMRRPVSRAGITLVSLTTSASPGASRSGRSRTPRSSSSGVAPGRTTSSRAASRGATGRSAMRSGGRSKSNRSVRMTARRHCRDADRARDRGVGHHRQTAGCPARPAA